MPPPLPQLQLQLTTMAVMVVDIFVIVIGLHYELSESVCRGGGAATRRLRKWWPMHLADLSGGALPGAFVLRGLTDVAPLCDVVMDLHWS